MSHPNPSHDETELIEQNLDKLEGIFFRDYHGDKEHFETEFDRWLSNFSIEELSIMVNRHDE